MAMEEYTSGGRESVHLPKEVKKMVVAGKASCKEGTKKETTIRNEYAESFYRITERQGNGDGRSCPTYMPALFFQGACKPTTPSSPALSRPGTRRNTEIRSARTSGTSASIANDKDYI